MGGPTSRISVDYYTDKMETGSQLPPPGVLAHRVLSKTKSAPTLITGDCTQNQDYNRGLKLDLTSPDRSLDMVGCTSDVVDGHTDSPKSAPAGEIHVYHLDTVYPAIQFNDYSTHNGISDKPTLVWTNDLSHSPEVTGLLTETRSECNRLVCELGHLSKKDIRDGLSSTSILETEDKSSPSSIISQADLSSDVNTQDIELFSDETEECVCPSASAICGCGKGQHQDSSNPPKVLEESVGEEEKLMRMLEELREEKTRKQEAIIRAQNRFDELEATRDGLSEKYTCKVDLVNQANRVFMPCRHLVCCNECALKMTSCPICREAIKAIIHVTIGGKPLRRPRRPPAPNIPTESSDNAKLPNRPRITRKRGPPPPRLPPVNTKRQ